MKDYHAQCEGKTPYESKAAAMERIRQQAKNRKRRRSRRGFFNHCKLMPYLCCWCHKWHVGSTFKKLRKANDRA